ncbi:SDR family NAD(P)-dependent oxidoreductase [Avrilella dinanensis]|uniref:Cyclopentanol dehydrogenase n=1 Tax=Avrilella dinanensis TaxID=2008672 RepID=A0A2M9R5D1_9FLAO|nr:glucose 1-dehydrogenase [Avrilella dinanensis]PJR04069.1 cyclopentanol dehydrogenase [Avrilella dinanensis]
MKRLEDKIAIITGGAGGLGAAEALLFAKEGAKLLITDIQEEGLKNVKNEITANGGIVDYIVHDVTSEQDWDKVVNKAIELYGAIHILVNNAGITGNLMSSIEETSVEEFKKVLDINILSQFIGIKAVVPHMKKNEDGASIINISSIAGIVGSAKATAYTASKGAVRSFTKGAAAELVNHKIRVNSVHPGYVATPMTKNLPNAEEFKKMAIGITPMRREAVPEEIAFGVLYLASDESSYTTGSEMVIDGGNTAV